VLAEVAEKEVEINPPAPPPAPAVMEPPPPPATTRYSISYERT
jgi:hypothetical protein